MHMQTNILAMDVPWEVGEWCCTGCGASGLAGLAGTGQTVALSAPQVTAGVFTAASAMGASWATAAIPFIGPAVAGVTLALGLWFNRKGPHQKIAATQIANEIEQHLQANVDAYFAGPRTPESREQAMQNFYAAWSALEAACGDPANGRPGQNCVSERARGGRIPGVTDVLRPGSWWEWYFDPIEQDLGPGALPNLPGGVDLSPGVTPTGLPGVTTASSPGDGGNGNGSGFNLPALLAVAGIGLVVYGLIGGQR